jgi:hypothetical protein
LTIKDDDDQSEGKRSKRGLVLFYALSRRFAVRFDELSYRTLFNHTRDAHRNRQLVIAPTSCPFVHENGRKQQQARRIMAGMADTRLTH